MKRRLEFLIIFIGFVGWLPCLQAEADNIEATDAVSDHITTTEAHEEHNFEIPAYTNEIAAIVNDDIITMERIRMDIAPLIKQIQSQSRSESEFRENLFNAELEALHSIINRKLIVQSFLAKGGKISDTYEKKEYENYLQHVFGGDRLEFAKFLKEYGKSVNEFKKDVKERAIIGFMMSELRAAQPEVSPAKIKEYYDSHLYEFFEPHELELKQIVLLNNENNNDFMDVTPAKLGIVEQALQSGEDFENVARKYSDNFANYNIGYVCPDDLLPAITEVVNSLTTGSYSEPISLNGATYIFFVSGDKPANQKTLQEASHDIEEILLNQYQEKARQKWMQNLRDKAYIKIFLTK